MPFTLAQHASAAIFDKKEAERFVEVVRFEDRASWHFLPIGPQIEERGGLLFKTFDEAQERSERENNPPLVPGVTAGAWGWFDRGIFIPIANQRDWRVPLYIPGISCFRVWQVIHHALAAVEEFGMSKELLWNQVRSSFPKISARRFRETLALYTSTEELVNHGTSYTLEDPDGTAPRATCIAYAKRRSHTRSL